MVPAQTSSPGSGQDGTSQRAFEDAGQWSSVQRYLARALLQVLIPATAAVAGLGIVMSMVPEFYLERLVVGAIFMAATLPPWRLYRRGEYLPGIRVLLVSLYLVCVGAVLFSGGIYEPAYIAMFALLVMSVWFVPRSVVLLFLAAFLVLGALQARRL